MAQHRFNIAVLACAAAVLSACSTVQIPDFNMPGLEQFREASAKLVEGYPEVSEAPVRPNDLRSAKEWDAAAKDLMAERGTFVVPEKNGLPETAQEVDKEVEALKAQVRAYKLDDPQ